MLHRDKVTTSRSRPHRKTATPRRLRNMRATIRTVGILSPLGTSHRPGRHQVRTIQTISRRRRETIHTISLHPQDQITTAVAMTERRRAITALRLATTGTMTGRTRRRIRMGMRAMR